MHEEKQLEKVEFLDYIMKTRGQLLLPIIVVTALLIMGRTPLFAGFGGIVTTILACLVRKDTRISSAASSTPWKSEAGASCRPAWPVPCC